MRRSLWAPLLSALLGVRYGGALRIFPRSPFRRRAAAAPRMCICVNCAFVDRCTAYHVVEAKHGQPHVAAAPDFTPRPQSPTVAINVFAPNAALIERGLEVELDVVACADFSEEAGRWARMMPEGTLVKAGFDPDFLPT